MVSIGMFAVLTRREEFNNYDVPQTTTKLFTIHVSGTEGWQMARSLKSHSYLHLLHEATQESLTGYLILCREAKNM